MHYTDKEQIEENTLKIVVYTHGTEKEGETRFEISSIHECKYFPPRLLRKLLKNPNKIFRDLDETKNLKQEEWWLLNIKQVDWNTINIEILQNVSDLEGFYTLH